MHGSVLIRITKSIFAFLKSENGKDALGETVCPLWVESRLRVSQSLWRR
jgi:hypothetical protein